MCIGGRGEGGGGGGGFFFFNDTATTEIYTLSLHDALPISHNLLCARICSGDTAISVECSAVDWEGGSASVTV